jgi:hypothetical protein
VKSNRLTRSEGEGQNCGSSVTHRGRYSLFVAQPYLGVRHPAGSVVVVVVVVVVLAVAEVLLLLLLLVVVVVIVQGVSGK